MINSNTLVLLLQLLGEKKNKKKEIIAEPVELLKKSLWC